MPSSSANRTAHFVDRAATGRSLAEPHLGSGAAVGDYNGDGWLDIFVTSFGVPGDMGTGRHRLYRNNQDGTFTDVAVDAGVNLASPELPDGLGAAFGDHDLDGYLDLFVAGWRKPGGDPALGNRLFHNNGDSTFSDVAAEAGIVDDGINGFNPTFVDMDGDRYPSCSFPPTSAPAATVNNTDGTFSDETIAHAASTVTWSGIEVTVGDVNNDSCRWFITAIFDDDAVGKRSGQYALRESGRSSFC
ncbi:MAG: VCBS repeat-containing protein [Caldilineaceae bacterium]